MRIPAALCAIAFAMAAVPVSAQDRAAPTQPGRTVYDTHCASCHGPDGTGFIGPPVIGPKAALGSYGDAQRLFRYISTAMPQNAPGSLDEQQYLDVVGYLLERNGVVETARAVHKEGLAGITLP